MSAQVQKVMSGVVTQLPIQGDEEISTHEPKDSFSSDSVVAEFKDCIQGGGATQIGCAALVGGSVVGVWWNRVRAAQLAKGGKFIEAGDLLMAKGGDAAMAQRHADAAELFYLAKGYYNKAGAVDKEMKAYLPYAGNSEERGRELVSARKDREAVRYYQQAAWAYAELHENDRAGYSYDALAGIYVRLEKPGEAAEAMENVARYRAKAGKFAGAAVAFRDAAGYRRNSLPDAPDVLKFVPKHRTINFFISLTDVSRNAAELRLSLARAIAKDYMNRFPLPYGCGGCGGFLEHIVYQYRKTAEEYFNAGEYKDAIFVLQELVETLERRGYGAGFEKHERLNAIQRGREMIDIGTKELEGTERGSEIGVLQLFKGELNKKFAELPDDVKAGDRSVAVAKLHIAVAEMKVLAGQDPSSEIKTVFEMAGFVEQGLGLRGEADDLRREADALLGLFNYEHVRGKRGEELPPMTLKERQDRIVQLQGLGVQVVKEKGLDGLKEQANYMVRYTEEAISEMEAERLYAKDGMTRGWFEVQRYYAKGQIYSILAGGGIGDEAREAEKVALWQELEAMRMRVEEMPEYRRDAADFRKMVEGMAEEGHEFAKDALRGMDASGQRNIDSKVLAIRMRLETAYRQFERAAMTEASDSFNVIAEIARSEGFKAVEVAAHVAKGDVYIIEGSLISFATGAYDAALSVLEGLKGETYQEMAKFVTALKAEALGEGGQRIVTDTWSEMHPKDWLFRNALAKLDGGVAKETLEDAVPPPEIAAIEGAAGRARALETRREFLDAFRTAKRAREAAGRAEKK